MRHTTPSWFNDANLNEGAANAKCLVEGFAMPYPWTVPRKLVEYLVTLGRAVSMVPLG